MRPPLLAAIEVTDWLAAHPAWRVIDGHLVREWRAPSHREAARLILDQVAIADRLDHHAVLTLTYRDLRVELWTHDRDGLTTLDLRYAGALEELLAARQGPIS